MNQLVPDYAVRQAELSSIWLVRYAHFIGVDERPFFGLRYDGMERQACGDVWQKWQRDIVAHYLAEAQLEIENEVGFFLTPRWVGGSDRPDETDVQPYRGRTHTRWAKIIEPGVRAEEIIATAPVDYTFDPATITVPYSAGVSLGEIHVFYPGTNVEVPYSQIEVMFPNMVIRIRRARLVKIDQQDNPKQGWDWSDTSPAGPFQAQVEVRRVYNDPTTQAVVNHATGCACANEQSSACIQVKNPDTGHIGIYPTGRGGCACKQSVSLNYRAGMTAFDPRTFDMTVRLAHAKMPNQPCGCDVAAALYQRDHLTPEYISPERLACPFGQADGAWQAFRYARSIKVYRAGVL